MIVRGLEVTIGEAINEWLEGKLERVLDGGVEGMTVDDAVLVEGSSKLRVLLTLIGSFT